MVGASEAAARCAEPCMPHKNTAFTRAFPGESALWFHCAR
jgi:hypothetical protein